MVVHQYERVYRAAVLLRSFSKPLEVASPIIVRKETRLAIVSTLDEMLRNSRQVDPWLSCHVVCAIIGLPRLDGGSEAGNGCFGPAGREMYSDPLNDGEMYSDPLMKAANQKCTLPP